MKRKPYQPVLLSKHKADCFAIRNQVKGFWQTPWAYLDHAEYRDAIGRKRASGGIRWWYVKCNCTGCPAAVLVCENTILGMLPHGRIARAVHQTGDRNGEA